MSVSIVIQWSKSLQYPGVILLNTRMKLHIIIVLVVVLIFVLEIETTSKMNNELPKLLF